MSPEEIARLRALCKAATPGPWLQPLEDERGAIVSAAEPEVSLLGLDRDRMAIFVNEADADLVVAARTAMPALLDEVERLKAEVRSLCTYSVEDYL